MVDREGHRVDAREILAVEQVLLARQSAALAPEIGAERADHRVEHRDRRHLQSAAALLQDLPQRLVDHREQDDAGIGLDPGDDALDLGAGAHHAPDMLDRLRLVELHEAGARHRMHGVAGRIGDEMQMKPGQRHRALLPAGPRTRMALPLYPRPLPVTIVASVIAGGRPGFAVDRFARSGKSARPGGRRRFDPRSDRAEPTVTGDIIHSFPTPDCLGTNSTRPGSHALIPDRARC